jgi:hypothetical protein
MRPQLLVCGSALCFVLVSCSSSDGGSGSSSINGGGATNGGATNGGAGASGGARASGGTAGTSSPSGGAQNPNGGASSSNGGASGGVSAGGISGASASAGSTSAGASSSGAGGAATASLPTIGGCPIFTADDAWNTPVTNEAVDDAWNTKMQALVGAVNIHPDYGTADIGIPINVVPSTQPKVSVAFAEPDESDPGPYPFPGPSVAKIEGGTPTNCDGDCHVLTVEQGACMLFEGDGCSYQNGWSCYSGAIFDLTKNSYGQRTKGFTSADAAGLAITPGLIRYDEASAGAIHHAIRFTVQCTLPKYVKPASHEAVPSNPPGCASNPNAVPMGIRVRLDPGVTVTNPSKAALAVITAMQTYGMILADNGSPFYFQGESSAQWTDADIEPLKQIPASAFKVVQVPPLEP